MHHRHGQFFDTDVELEVRDVRHLTNISAALRACPTVETVERARG
jgi:GTP pyrophosphokinase/guanosine-3',5'-bis(diphosphate) 3'-pyrophosphohydrolase